MSRVDRDSFVGVIRQLWDAGQFDHARAIVDTVISAYPNDHYPYCMRAQGEVLRLGVLANNPIKKVDQLSMIRDIEKSILLLDKEEIERDAQALNEAAIAYVLLASVLTSAKGKSNARKAKKAAEWVTNREVIQSEEYCIQESLLGTAYIKLATSLLQIQECSVTEFQSALVGAISNFRKAGFNLCLENAERLHFEVFGYIPISLSNLDQGFMGFIEAPGNRYE